jgi:hypothetical protein
MTDVMRDMIAQLMGAQRAEEEGRRVEPYDHHSVHLIFTFSYITAGVFLGMPCISSRILSS